MKRSTGLTCFALWVFALGGYSLARAWVLLHQWAVLVEVGASISPLVIAWSVLWGVGLIVAGVGLWLRREWGRRLALVCIPLYYLCGLINQFVFVLLARSRRGDGCDRHRGQRLCPLVFEPEEHTTAVQKDNEGGTH